MALTVHEDTQYFFEMASAGASGYIPMRAATDDLVTAIRTVHAGQVYVYPSIAQALAESYRQRTQKRHGQHKLNLHSRADLVRYAVDKGLVSLDRHSPLG